MFLDRDGVLIHDTGYVCRVKDVKLFADVGESLKSLKEHGFLLIVVTNQSGVARGMFDLQAVADCHEELQRQLRPFGVSIDAFYLCPHHHEGRVSPYNIKCSCRKPGPGMFDQAAAAYAIDFTRSYIIGDRPSDIDCGLNYKLAFKGIQINRGQYPLHAHPWKATSNFEDAARLILSDQDYLS